MPQRPKPFAGGYEKGSGYGYWYRLVRMSFDAGLGLPKPPPIIAAGITADVEAALDQFATIEEDLKL